MTSTKKEDLDEIVNREKMGDKKFHSETSLQKFGEEEGMEASETGNGDDPGVSTANFFFLIV